MLLDSLFIKYREALAALHLINAGFLNFERSFTASRRLYAIELCCIVLEYAALAADRLAAIEVSPVELSSIALE